MPDTLGQLVATVGGPASKTGDRLEKEASTCSPKALLIVRIDHFGAGNVFEQYLLRRLGNAQRLQLRRIAEHCEPPLVGIQRVGLWVRCQHNPTIQVGFTQRAAAGFLQIKISEPVVNQIDGEFTMPQHTAAPLQRRRTANNRAHTVTLEQLLKKQKLGVEILVFWPFVDDGNTQQCIGSTAEMPFMAKHINYLLLKVGCLLETGRHFFHRRATSPLRPRQQRIEHGPACIGIDLDEPQTALMKVKVVAKKGSSGTTGLEAGNGGRGGQDLLTVRGKRHDRFDGVHQLRHDLQLHCRHKHRLRGEQVRAALPNHFRQDRLIDLSIERKRQRVWVKRQAKAAAIEDVRMLRLRAELRRG